MSFVKFYHPAFAHSCSPRQRCATKSQNTNTIVSMPYNVIKTESGWTLELKTVGYVKEELNITLEDNILKIASIESSTQNPDSKNYLRKEFKKVPFENKFRIPAGVNLEAISANMNQGILTIELPISPIHTQNITIQ